jgi:RNA polymerase sigma-70 factor (ECF subfamily)
MNETKTWGNAQKRTTVPVHELPGAPFSMSNRARPPSTHWRLTPSLLVSRPSRSLAGVTCMAAPGMPGLAERRLFDEPPVTAAKDAEMSLQSDGPGLLVSGIRMRIPKAWAHPGSGALPDDEATAPEPTEPSFDDSRQHAREEAAVQLVTREDFEAAVAPVVPRLYRLCLALTGTPDQAEDLLQAGLLKAYERRASYAGRGNVAAWLAGIIRHEHDETLRRTLRRKSLLDRAMQEIYNLLDSISGAPAPDPESWTSSHEQAALLLQCVHELSEPYRTVVWLCDIEEMNYEEVAEMLSVPIGTVKSRHARGRKQLRRTLERRGGMS